MAYTEAQWNKFQASLPLEERMSYLEYLRVTDPAAYDKFVAKSTPLSRLKADAAEPYSSPVTVVDERGRIVGTRVNNAAQTVATKENTVSNFRAKEAADLAKVPKESISAIESKANARRAQNVMPSDANVEAEYQAYLAEQKANQAAAAAAAKQAEEAANAAKKAEDIAKAAQAAADAAAANNAANAAQLAEQAANAAQLAEATQAAAEAAAANADATASLPGAEGTAITARTLTPEYVAELRKKERLGIALNDAEYEALYGYLPETTATAFTPTPTPEVTPTLAATPTIEQLREKERLGIALTDAEYEILYGALPETTTTADTTTPTTTTPTTTTPTTTTPTTTTPTTTTPTTTTPTTTTPTTTTPTTTTPTTTASVYTQAELDAAIAAAEAAAIAEAEARAAQVAKDAETAAAAAAAIAAGGGAGLTQADLDRAIQKALAEQQAKTAAQAREAKAAEDAAKLAQKTKASQRLEAMFEKYGLKELAGFINRRIMAEVSEDMLMLELYEQPEYKLRFPGMEALRAKGRTITESEYIKDEEAFIQTARFFDIPKGFYDSPDDFGRLIGNLVSPKEFQDRLQIGQDLGRSLSPGVRQQLQELYNIGEGGITAYVLDPDRAEPILRKQAKAAQFVGFGREQGFKLEGMTAAQAEQIVGTEAYAKLSGQQLQTALGQASQLRQTQSRLTGIEGQVYDENEALKAVIEGSPQALLASQQRAQREGARFGGSTGVTGSSLRTMPTI